VKRAPKKLMSILLKRRAEYEGKDLKSGRAKRKAHRSIRPVSRKPAASGTHKKRSSHRRKTTTVSAKHLKAKAPVSRARAAAPARSTHATAPALVMPGKRRTHPLPSPMPLRHVAPPRPVLVSPARSMPPARDIRRPATAAGSRAPLAVPDFSEAGVLLAITYSIREGRRGEFFDLMRELKPLLVGIGGMDCTIYEDRSRPNYLMEVFRFKDEAEFTAFDDKFHKDRKIAAIYALLDDIVEAEKSDFKIFERRL
jgi:hypothetical protein